VSNKAVEKKIPILLNGQFAEVPAGLSVAALLDHLGIEPSRVAVELNRQIVRKPAWTTAQVQDGAQVEIVQFVGGG
jgi:thiamine biosynthesis protein ThiS